MLRALPNRNRLEIEGCSEKLRAFPLRTICLDLDDESPGTELGDDGAEQRLSLKKG